MTLTTKACGYVHKLSRFTRQYCTHTHRPIKFYDFFLKNVIVKFITAKFIILEIIITSTAARGVLQSEGLVALW
jgi:hypothetical protein